MLLLASTKKRMGRLGTEGAPPPMWLHNSFKRATKSSNTDVLSQGYPSPPKGDRVTERLVREELEKPGITASDEAHLQQPRSQLQWSQDHISSPVLAGERQYRSNGIPTSSTHRNVFTVPHQEEVCSTSVTTGKLPEEEGKPFYIYREHTPALLQKCGV